MAKEIASWQVKIFTSWKRYKKLIPAICGVALLIILKNLDIDIPGLASAVLDWLIGSATVFGVYQLKNEQKPEAIIVDTNIKKVV